MDKELIQKVIDNLSLSHPRREDFERELRELIAKYEHPIRLYCEGQSENPTTEL